MPTRGPISRAVSLFRTCCYSRIQRRSGSPSTPANNSRPHGQATPSWRCTVSRNRSLHTGYKIVRLPFKDGKPTGEYQDFVVGFTAGEEGVWGRPVNVTFAHDGSMLFSEDGNGTVYRVSYKAK